MCNSIEIMDGDTVAAIIETAEEAIAAFGREHVFYIGNGKLAPETTHNYCLCPIDVQRIARECGYVMLEERDPRYSYFDHRFEKRAA